MVTAIIVYLVGVIAAYFCIAKSNSTLDDAIKGLPVILAVFSWGVVSVYILMWAIKVSDGVTWPFKKK